MNTPMDAISCPHHWPPAVVHTVGPIQLITQAALSSSPPSSPVLFSKLFKHLISFAWELHNFFSLSAPGSSSVPPGLLWSTIKVKLINVLYKWWHVRQIWLQMGTWGTKYMWETSLSKQQQNWSEAAPLTSNTILSKSKVNSMGSGARLPGFYASPIPYEPQASY